MTRLTQWREDRPEAAGRVTNDAATTANLLAAIGVRFERWPATQALRPGAEQAEILAAYATEIARLNRQGGYQSADVIRLARGTPDTAPMRNKFLDEHTHAEDEVRFFVEGAGAFYLRAAGHVHQVICVAGDLLGVPAGLTHWFDMGPDPHFTAIRLFTSPAGWVANFTGDEIARRFPLYDGASWM